VDTLRKSEKVIKKWSSSENMTVLTKSGAHKKWKQKCPALKKWKSDKEKVKKGNSSEKVKVGH
jgi:hypothetical protein